MQAAERLFGLQQLDTRSDRLREEMMPLRRALEGDPTAPDPRPEVDRLRAELSQQSQGERWRTARG